MTSYPTCGAMYVDINGDDRLCCLAEVHRGPHTDTAGSPHREMAPTPTRERRAKANKRWGFVERLVASLLTQTMLAFLYGWYLMLAIGILHHNIWPQLPPIGYWTAVVLVALLRPLFSPYTVSRKAQS